MFFGDELTHEVSLTKKTHTIPTMSGVVSVEKSNGF
jgi:hypothetical protein